MIRISEDGIYENEALASAGASFYTRNIKNDKKQLQTYAKNDIMSFKVFFARIYAKRTPETKTALNRT